MPITGRRLTLESVFVRLSSYVVYANECLENVATGWTSAGRSGRATSERQFAEHAIIIMRSTTYLFSEFAPNAAGREMMRAISLR